MGLLDDIFGIGDDDDKTTPTPGRIIPTLPSITLPGITLGPPGLPTPPAPSSPPAVSSPPLSPSAPASSSAPPSSPSVPATSPPPTTPLPEAPSAPSAPSSSDSIQTQTQVVVVGGSASQSAANNAGSTQRAVSFLENKPLSGAIFGLVGLVGLVLIFTIATFFLRRRKRSRLHDDAMSFDPGFVAAADRMDQEKTGHSSHPSLGSQGAGSQGAGVGGGYSNYAASLPPQQHADFYPHQPAQIDYYGQQQQAYATQQNDYYGGRQPNYAYAPPMSDSSHGHGSSWGQQAPAPVPTPTPPPKDQQPLARKNSIPRVPVPPIAAPLPDEFGSSDAERRRSAEETEFWARTLKVANE
jgi:hypothetical protein